MSQTLIFLTGTGVPHVNLIKDNAEFCFIPRIVKVFDKIMETFFKHFWNILEKCLVMIALKALYMLINLKLLPLLYHFI